MEILSFDLRWQGINEFSATGFFSFDARLEGGIITEDQLTDFVITFFDPAGTQLSSFDYDFPLGEEFSEFNFNFDSGTETIFQSGSFDAEDGFDVGIDFGPTGIGLDFFSFIAPDQGFTEATIVLEDNLVGEGCDDFTSEFCDRLDTGGVLSARRAPDLIFGTPTADALDSELIEGFRGVNDRVFLGDGDDLIDVSQAGGNNRIAAGSGLDELIAGRNDRLFGEAGNDILEASVGSGGNRLYGGDGNDELVVGSNDRAFGGSGDDRLTAVVGGGNNRLYGQAGRDQFELGSNDQVFGGGGEDVFFFTSGGGNRVTGGAGADLFWLVTAELPNGMNTLTDYEIRLDRIGVAGIGLSDPSSLEFTQLGNDTVISLDGIAIAKLLSISASVLESEGQFVFA